MKPKDVVAVLNNVSWETGPTDTIYFSGQISIHNKQTIQSLILVSITNEEVTFEFEVYEYDPLSKNIM